MSEDNLLLEKCVLELFDVGVVKFGSFILKSGMKSPFYIDLRRIIAYPKLLEEISELLWKARTVECDQICGVPYTALPLAAIISTKQLVPMVIRRKEAKNYGTKMLIEGVFSSGQKCLIVEDVIVSGSSVYETVEALKTVSLDVSEAVVFVDREQGGNRSLVEKGIKINSVITITEILEILHDHNKIDDVSMKNSLNFIKTNQTSNFSMEPKMGENIVAAISRTTMDLSTRMSLTGLHPIASNLLRIITDKETNVCLAADFEYVSDLLEVANMVGPHICILKTHVDVLKDFSQDAIKKLEDLAQLHNFLLFEDRKFSDIGNTVQGQFKGGPFHICDWAHMVTLHGIPGDGVVKALKGVSAQCEAGVIVAQMSSSGTLTDSKYSEACISMCESHRDFLFAFVSQSNLSDDPRLIQMTPGVHITEKGDQLGQNYCSPEEAVSQKGADIVIVGRGITKAANIKVAAMIYQGKAFRALSARTKVTG